jgi:transcriptional regulator GlxA family with amidase domain
VRPRQHDDAAVGAAQLLVAGHFADANPVAGITAASGLTTRTFKRRFEAATGCSPLDCVLSRRIEVAKKMLEASDTPIDVVAAEAGHAEPAAFRRIFRRGTGISPLQYRRKFLWIAPGH